MKKKSNKKRIIYFALFLMLLYFWSMLFFLSYQQKSVDNWIHEHCDNNLTIPSNVSEYRIIIEKNYITNQDHFCRIEVVKWKNQ